MRRWIELDPRYNFAVDVKFQILNAEKRPTIQKFEKFKISTLEIFRKNSNFAPKNVVHSGCSGSQSKEGIKQHKEHWTKPHPSLGQLTYNRLN